MRAVSGSRAPGGSSCGCRLAATAAAPAPAVLPAHLFTAASPLRPLRRCGSSPSICMKCVALESDLDWNIQADHPVYKDPANGKCTVCTAHPRSTGCVACNGQGRCSACDEGFVLVNGTCKKVSHSCEWGNCAAAAMWCALRRRTVAGMCRGAKAAVRVAPCCMQ